METKYKVQQCFYGIMHSEFKFASPGVVLCMQWQEGVILASSPYGPFHLYSKLQQSKAQKHVEADRYNGEVSEHDGDSLKKLSLLVCNNPWGHDLAWPAPGCQVVFHLCTTPPTPRPNKGQVSLLAVSQNWSQNFSFLLAHP